MHNPRTYRPTRETNQIDSELQKKLEQADDVLVANEYEISLDQFHTLHVRSETYQSSQDPTELEVTQLVHLNRLDDDGEEETLARFAHECGSEGTFFICHVGATALDVLETSTAHTTAEGNLYGTVISLARQFKGSFSIGESALDQEDYMRLDIAPDILRFQSLAHDLCGDGSQIIDRSTSEMIIMGDPLQVNVESYEWRSSDRRVTEVSLRARVAGHTNQSVYERNPQLEWLAVQTNLTTGDTIPDSRTAALHVVKTALVSM